ncbi:hypothetical protein FIBSPDRAFT_871532 [Athelia psychrophila]|uniref:Uncharacterized protein n=1 Tax=Athelia psychrophila TaxID=1759441 RepID=A0A166A8R5_9AGAM|nr:hypothetical protein FIBSPDRAFT_871532 [Fibularhizoctonia sp. CBS 109695]
MYSWVSGGGRPLDLSVSLPNSLVLHCQLALPAKEDANRSETEGGREKTETHRFQNGMRHIAPTIPNSIPRNIVPV